MTHTPGPWTITETEFAGATAIMVDPVAIVLGHGRTPNANAKLIAAAPEMLAIIEMIARMDTPTDGVTDQEKADDIMADLDDERLCSDASALYELIRQARALTSTI